VILFFTQPFLEEKKEIIAHASHAKAVCIKNTL
jgi:hypothetical protein